MKCNAFLVLIAVFLGFLFCGCRTTATTASEWSLTRSYEKEYEELFSLYNSYGGSVCMGISGPYLDESAAIEVATQNCVKYLAFIRGLAVQVKLGTVTDSSMSGISVEYEVVSGTSDRIYNEVVNEFEIVDYKWLGGKVGAVVFARLPEMSVISIIRKIIDIDVPEIDGYYVAVAPSDFIYSSFVSAIEASTFRAAEALISVHEGTVSVGSSIIKTTTTQKTTQYRNESYSISGNRLSRFSVLAYEYNEKENKVYALAVCKE